ncbi:hypothetical protein HN011_005080 [Eciton burchellii]|nr:hypothetical protein HN011_005080 [Eciton burchellii]
MESDSKVSHAEDTSESTAETTTENISATSASKSSSNIEKREKLYIPRGKRKSGKIWKDERKRFSSIIKTRGIRLSFAKKQKLRADMKHVKEMSRAIKEDAAAKKEEKKKRRRENLKKAEENNRKGEVVQVIKNTAKIKRMRKKQLRMIETRDTLNM